MEHPLDGSAARPAGPLRFVWFDGILTGPRDAAAAARSEAATAAREGPFSFSLEEDPARITLLLSDRPVAGSGVVGDCREALAASLRRIVSAAPRSAAWESTVRCTEVFADSVRESLFNVREGEVRCLSRTRPSREDDWARAPERPAPRAAKPPTGAVAAVAALLLLVFGLTAWRGGWIDRVFAESGRSLEVDTGPFRDLVEVRIEDSWGSYRVSLTRGSRYPTTKEASQSLTTEAGTPVEAAAVSAVVNGLSIYIRVEDATGHVLSATEVSLRDLLVRETPMEPILIPGRIAARKLVLSMDKGQSQR